jgi:uncharacterized protein (DUF2147 family)
MLRKFILTLPFLVGAAPAFAADPVEGTWKTKPDASGSYGYVKIAACGAALCGTLTQKFDSAGKAVSSANIGKKVIWDMIAAGGGQYTDGKIWVPESGKTYDSKMQLSGSSLDLKGCQHSICRDAGTWTKVN